MIGARCGVVAPGRGIAGGAWGKGDGEQGRLDRPGDAGDALGERFRRFGKAGFGGLEIGEGLAGRLQEEAAGAPGDRAGDGADEAPERAERAAGETAWRWRGRRDGGGEAGERGAEGLQFRLGRFEAAGKGGCLLVAGEEGAAEGEELGAERGGGLARRHSGGLRNDAAPLLPPAGGDR